MNKTERAELRLVKQQFRVVRAEVDQHRAQMLVDVERQIAARYHDEDVAWAAATRLAHEIVADADRRANDTFRDLVGESFSGEGIVSAWMPKKRTEHRRALVHEAHRRIDAGVKTALVRVARSGSGPPPRPRRRPHPIGRRQTLPGRHPGGGAARGAAGAGRSGGGG